MIRIQSIKQALSLQGTIPELAIIRSIQFMGDGYMPEVHGHIIVLHEGDSLTQIKEIGTNGLFDNCTIPTYEFVDSFVEDDHLVFEVVFQIDDSRTVAVIIDERCIDDHLRTLLKKSSLTPLPLPQLKRRAP